MRPPILALVLAAAGLLGADPRMATAQAVDGPRVAAVELAGNLLTLSPNLGFDSATLRVAGPGGYEAIAWSQGEPFVVDLVAAGFVSPSDGVPGGRLQALPEGRYRFEAVCHRAGGEPWSHSGSFEVENGLAQGARVDRGGGPRSGEDPGRTSTTARDNGLAEKAGGTDDLFLINDGSLDGEVNLQMNSRTGTGEIINYWGVRNQDGELRLSTTDGGSWTDHVTVEPDGRVGLGTTNPQADLHIFRPGGNIRITDLDACPNPNAAWEIEEDFGRMKFEVVPNCPGDLDGGKMWIHGNGNVGIGTADPESSLHIYRPFPAIRLTDSDGCAEPAPSWRIDQFFSRLRFAVHSQCPGDPAGVKMTIHASGNVGIGTVSPEAMLHVTGDGLIEGDVALGSSRTIKHEIEPVDGGEILDTIRGLALYEWKYKDDPEQAAHVGPMAEDVHAAFGLGRDEKHLSPADSAGLALAAIQGLDREVAELRAENAALAARNHELLERLAALEERFAASAGEARGRGPGE